MNNKTLLDLIEELDENQKQKPTQEQQALVNRVSDINWEFFVTLTFKEEKQELQATKTLRRFLTLWRESVLRCSSK